MTHVRIALVAAASLGFAAFSSAAQAKVHINVDLDAQTIHVESAGKTFDWKVSSGKPGYETPNGTFKVLWMDKDHFSDTYDKAPMPNAIFFAPGYAIHGASKSAWGHPASHGCVRLPVGKAAMLFEMVKKQGAEITLTGGSEASTEVAEKLKSGKTVNTGVVAEPAAAPQPQDQYGYDDPRGGQSGGDYYYAPPRDLTAHDPLYGEVY